MKCHLLAPLAVFACLAACSEPVDVPPQPTIVSYSTTEATLPIPNDLLFSGTLDATLNFPDPEDPAQAGLFDALNSLDGWSTTAPITFNVSEELDPSSLVAGSNVRLFEVTLAVDPNTGLRLGTPVVDVVRELASPAEFVAAPTQGNRSVSILPTRPLAPKTSYMLVVTNTLRDVNAVGVERGESYLIASLSDAEAPLPADHPLLPLRPLVRAMEDMASTDSDVSPAIDRDSIAVTATFTTQSTFDALATAQAVAFGLEGVVIAGLCAQLPFGCDSTTPLNTLPSGAVGTTPIGTTATFVPGSPGFADIYAGSLTLPYYLTAATNSGGGLVQDTAPLTEHWRARYTFFPGDPERNVTQTNPLALETGPETLPVLVSLPNGASGQTQPGGGWPLTIFQHGITRDRTDMLALADAFAAQGIALIAIDLPLHGISDSANPLHVGVTGGGLRERTFGLDLVTQDGAGNITASVPDGTADSSGAHFINLTSLQTQRDNLRQAVADLFALEVLILSNPDVDGVGLAADFDLTQVSFLGHSLGAIVGTTFAALDATATTPLLSSVSLNAPGGGIPRMLEASPSYGPIVIGGLAAAGVEQGTPEFDQFMFAAQTVIDSGDPINFCAALAGGAAVPVFLQEVVGGGPAGGLTDQVVVNNVPTAPLSGTDPMVAVMALPNVGANAAGPAASVRFWEGSHGSLLDPTTNATATAEMQAQVLSWVLSAGTMLTVGNNGPTGVIEQ